MFEELKTQGILHYQQSQFSEALTCFTKALQEKPTSYVVYAHRATTFLSLGLYDAALRDATQSLHLKVDYPKADALIARSLIALNRVEEAKDIVADLPLNEFREVHEICNLAVEQKRGLFDPVRLYQDPTYVVTDYVGPVEVRNIENKGRGVVATSHIRAGTLLMVCRAIAIANDVGERTAANKMASSLVSRSAMDNKTKSVIMNLFAGPSFLFPSATSALQQTITADLCFGVIEYNAFEVQNVKDGQIDRSGLMRSVGLWDFPSMVNHDTRPTATHTFAFDCIVFRAVQDLIPGDEVTTYYTGVCDPFSVRAERLKKHFVEQPLDDDDEEDGVEVSKVSQRALERLETDAETSLHEVESHLRSKMRSCTDPAMALLHVAAASLYEKVENFESAATQWTLAAVCVSRRVPYSLETCLYHARAILTMQKVVRGVDATLAAMIATAEKHHAIVYGSSSLLRVFHPAIVV
eukprot:PhF_6_TR4842/c0_g1_i2/m.6750